MRRRIVFATQEYDTMHSGGASALIGELSRRLVRHHEVIVVLAAPQASDADVGGVRVVGVPIPEPDGTLGWFVERSRSLADGVARVIADTGPVDLVEFTDFEATALWALAHRDALGLVGTRLAMRFHGPIEAITASIGAAPHPLDTLGRIEADLLPLADAVLVPSEAVGAQAAKRYGLEAERLVFGPPQVPPVVAVDWSPAPTAEFFAFGRLAEQKGPHDLIAAIVPVLDDHPEAVLRFIGPDGWSAIEHRPMSEVLTALIPERLRSRVTFEGPMPRDEAMAAMASAWAVVVASRFETFCLAAHEARRAGLPVLAPAMPAFAGYEDGYGMRVYDGSIGGLTAVLGEIAAGPELSARLAAEPPPPVGDPVLAYAGPLPDPQPVAAQQAGERHLATHLAASADGATGAGVRTAAERWRVVARLLPGPVRRWLRQHR